MSAENVEMNDQEKETVEMMKFLDNLNKFKKEKGVTPQLEMWYSSEEAQEQNERFVTMFESLMVTTLLAENLETQQDIQGLIGKDWIRFNIGNQPYEFEIDWAQEQNRIFFEGPDKAAKFFVEKIREQVVEAAKNRGGKKK